MDIETQKKLARIQQVNLDNLVKLQAQTREILDDTLATHRWVRRCEPWLLASACLAVGTAIVATGVQFAKLFLH